MEENIAQKNADTRGKMHVQKIKLSQIEVDKGQPRKDIINVGELASSINKEGLMSPIEVIDLGNSKYRIIDGERRFSAYKLLKKEEIDCIIKSEIKNVFIRQLISDFHKEKLNLVEQADAIKKLEDEGYNLEDIKMLLGIGTTKFQTLKKVLRFNGNTRQLIKEGTITQNIINNISMNDLDENKEDQIINEVVQKKAKSKYQISKIILERSNIRYIVNKYLTDSYVFEKRTCDFNKKLEENKKLIDKAISEIIKSNSNELERELSKLKFKVESIWEELQKRKKLVVQS